MNVITTVSVGAAQLQKFPTKTTAANYISQVDVFACVPERAEGQAGLSAVSVQQSLMQRNGCKFRRVVGCYKSDMMFRTRCQQSCNVTMGEAADACMRAYAGQQRYIAARCRMVPQAEMFA